MVTNRVRRNLRRRGSQSSPDAQPHPAEGGDTAVEARFAITEIGNWVRAADAKTTVLTAAIGIVLAAVSTSADAITRGLHHSGTARYWLLAPALAILLVASLAGAWSVYQVLTPRTTVGVGMNHFAWPAVAGQPQPPIPRPNDDLQAEAWEQAHLLAHIAAKKYHAFQVALRWFGLQAFSATASVAAATWITGGH
jgi:hypothetical protein